MTYPLLPGVVLPDRDGDGFVKLGVDYARQLGVPVGTVVERGPDDPQRGPAYWPAGQVPVAQAARPRVEPPVIQDWPAPVEAARTSTSRAETALLGTREGRAFAGTGVAYRLAAGCKDTVIRRHALARCGVLVRRYGGSIDGLTIEDVRHVAGRYAPGVGRGLYQATGRQSRVTIRRVVYRCDEPITRPGDIYAGITLAGKGTGNEGSGYLFEDLDLEGFRVDYPGDDYPNCDGISIEGGYADGIVNRVRIANCADGGIDIKGKGWRLDNLTVEHAHKSIKYWADLTVGSCRSVEPRGGHIYSMAGKALAIDYLEAVDAEANVPLVRFENKPGVVTIKEVSPETATLIETLIAKKALASATRQAKGSRLILPDGREIVA